MKQALVTIYLYEGTEDHVRTHEHLRDYLDNDWRVVSIVPLNPAGGGTSEYVTCWFVVLLERAT